MSGIHVWALTAKAVLTCNRCGARWESEPFHPVRYQDQEDAAAPAFDAGWRVMSGARSLHSYCPQCGPSTYMRQVLPKAVAS